MSNNAVWVLLSAAAGTVVSLGYVTITRSLKASSQDGLVDYRRRVLARLAVSRPLTFDEVLEALNAELEAPR